MQHLSLHYCSEPPFSIYAKMPPVDDIEADHLLIKGLVDWAEGGIPSRVASAIGVAATTITRHYNGKATTRLGRGTLLKLRQQYPDYPGWLTRNNNVRSEVSSFGDRPFEEKFGQGELAAIPVIGSAIGMSSFDPERDIELTELDMSEVLDHVARPQSIANDKQAYALTVIGDSMSPKYDPGTRIIVSPKAPVSINDYVVVQLKGADGEDQFEERVTLVLVKRLVRRSGSFIELRQFNPDETFRVDVNRVRGMHKVIGEVY